MIKNKFIKALKIFAVFFPLIFGFVAKPLALFVYSNGYALTQYTENDINNIYMIKLEDNASNEVDKICQNIFVPYMQSISLNGYSDIPIAYQLSEFILNNFFTMTFQDAIDIMQDYPSNTVPIGCFMIFIWYIFVEIVFFIPEVILLFIRWAKNLLYAFTRKGGFDC